MSIFVGDQKTTFELVFRDYDEVDGIPTDVGPLDISSASEVTFIFKKPDDTVVQKTKTGGNIALTTNGTDGKAYYNSETDFIDQEGTWQLQGKVAYPNGSSYNSAISSFSVLTPLV